MIVLLDRVRTFLFRFLRLRTLGAMVLAVDDSGVLLIRQAYGSRAWTLPGGGVKRRESFRAAALREAREEVGLRLTHGGSAELLGVYLKKVGSWTDHVGLFVLQGWERQATNSWEIAEVATFPLDALPTDLSPATRRRIDEWRTGSTPAECW